MDTKGENFNIVNVICLGETTSKRASLLTCNGTIKMIFEAKDPLVYDNVSIC